MIGQIAREFYLQDGKRPGLQFYLTTMVMSSKHFADRTSSQPSGSRGGRRSTRFFYYCFFVPRLEGVTRSPTEAGHRWRIVVRCERRAGSRASAAAQVKHGERTRPAQPTNASKSPPTTARTIQARTSPYRLARSRSLCLSRRAGASVSTSTYEPGHRYSLIDTYTRVWVSRR